MVPASNLVAYLLGAVALSQPPWVVVAASVSAVLLLGTRERLHGLIRIVPQDELLTAGNFLILVGIILPLVPDQPVMAVTPLTPFHVWLAVVAVCTMSYLTYLLQKYAPARKTTLLPAILGGIYSSTATTVVLAKRQRDAGIARSELAAGILAATAMMYLRLGAVVALFNVNLASALAPALAILVRYGYSTRNIRVAKDRGAARHRPPDSGDQSVANRGRDHLRRDLCRHLGRYRLYPHDVRSDRCVVLGGPRGDNRHRSIRDQHRPRGRARPVNVSALGRGSDRGIFEQHREGGLCPHLRRN